MTFAVTVDLVVFTIREDELSCSRSGGGCRPTAGGGRFPGASSRKRRGLLDAAQRGSAEETGLDGATVHLEQLADVGGPSPRSTGRGWSAWPISRWPPSCRNRRPGRMCRKRVGAEWPACSPARARLAFDHSEILADGLERARAKLEYSPPAAAFCRRRVHRRRAPPRLRGRVGTELDPRNFTGRSQARPGSSPTGRTTTRNGGRPAQLYRRGKATVLNPPISR